MVVQLEGREIAVVDIAVEYLAYTNWCAHRGGPACEGKIAGTTSSSHCSVTSNRSISPSIRTESGSHL